MNDKELVWLVDRPSAIPTSWGESLAKLGFQVRGFERADHLIEALETERPEAILVVLGANPKVTTESLHVVSSQSVRRSIPMIGLTNSCPSPEVLGSFDDWVSEVSLPEIGARIQCARERLSLGGTSGVGSRFLSVLVHDLRTPLNVIILTHRVIEQSLSRGDVDIAEDLGYLRDNAMQIERMLSLVGDYCGLLEPHSAPSLCSLDPRRYMEDLLEDKAWQGPSRSVSKRLEVEPSCPRSVWIDPTLGRLALIHSLGNAASSASGQPIIVKLAGDDEYWKVTIQVDRPSPKHVESFDLEPGNYVRLRGTTTERRGFDLALASRILRQFGGRAELVVVPDESSSIILQWPLHRELANSNGH